MGFRKRDCPTFIGGRDLRGGMLISAWAKVLSEGASASRKAKVASPGRWRRDRTAGDRDNLSRGDDPDTLVGRIDARCNEASDATVETGRLQLGTGPELRHRPGSWRKRPAKHFA